ncbi:MAG TPA: flagellar basal body rod protein FlgB [Cellvibrionaceae bacterium]
MTFSFDQALGIHETAFKVRARRAEVLANNLANADTPGFKARDLDFKAMLSRTSSGNLEMARTARGHMSPGGASDVNTAELAYRTPHQMSVDGNTVEDQVEHAEFMKNALAYQAGFTLLNSRFKGLNKALSGQ